MDCRSLVISFCVVVVTFSHCNCGLSEDSGSVNEEYCQHETMKGRCRWKSEVIVMKSARWGRMKTGRCLDIHPDLLAAMGNNPLFLGCYADVLQILDRKCSGRSECDVRITDSELDAVKPCYPDQIRFLEASFTCVKVVQESRSCAVSVTTDPQYISSSSSTFDSGSVRGASVLSCGSKSTPWRLEAPLGQRINISLLDFASRKQQHDKDVTSCRQYGNIVDKNIKKNVSICAGVTGDVTSSQRHSHVYVSQSNIVDVVLTGSETTDADQLNFLVEMNAIGCTNIIPPENAWLKRSNNDIVIGCYLTHQTWQLRCDGHEWKGLVGTCPESRMVTDIASANVEVIQEAITDNKLYLAMIVIAGCAVVFCITIVCTGVYCLNRSKRHYRLKQEDCLSNGKNNGCTLQFSPQIPVRGSTFLNQPQGT